MDFDNRKVYGDTSITDGLVYVTYQPAVLSSSFTMLCDYLSEMSLQASQALERLEEGRGDEAPREEEGRRPTFSLIKTNKTNKHTEIL